MPGFFVSNIDTKISLKDAYPERCIKAAPLVTGMGGGKALCQTLNKFLQDKAFVKLGDRILILEGCLLNKADLFEKMGVRDVPALMASMYSRYGEDFFRHFRGSFSGAVYDGTLEKWIVFTNHAGDAAVFYCCAGGKFAAGSQITYILDWCKEQEIQKTFNESCAYQMLTFGYVVSDETYAKEIKRLHGGDYLVWQDGQLSVRNYHRFVKHTERFEGKTESEIIEAIDYTFRQAVAKEWGKDEEYNYEHLADLSGGLDSRMNVWVAHEEMDCRATILTYCKEGYLDESIARQIAEYWNDTFIFKSLDDAAFMYDIDKNTALLGGLSLYSGITGGRAALESLEMDRFGIEHTGMIGDAVLGSFLRSSDDEARKWPSGMYSEKLSRYLPEHIKMLSDGYDAYEIYLIYARGFRGACNTHLLRRNYTEVSSPFLNVEFLQLCFDIPVQIRIGHHIYKKWIISKYPQAARFQWEKTGGMLTEPAILTQMRRWGKKGPKMLLRLLGKDAMIADGMNPIDYWLAANKVLRNYLDTYMCDGIKRWAGLYSPALSQNMERLYNTGNASEKAMVLTVLAATKLYFGGAIDGADRI